MLFHYRHVDGVASGEVLILKYDLLRSFYHGGIDREHLVDDPEQRIESGLNGSTTIYGDIAVKNFLQDLRVRNQPLLPSYEIFDQTLCIGLVRVRCPYEIHRDVGIYEDHGR